MGSRCWANVAGHGSRMLGEMLSILEHHAQRVIASVYSKVIFHPYRSELTPINGLNIRLPDVSGHLNIPCSGHRFTLYRAKYLDRAFPVGHPRASVSNKLLVGKLGQDF